MHSTNCLPGMPGSITCFTYVFIFSIFTSVRVRVRVLRIFKRNQFSLSHSIKAKSQKFSELAHGLFFFSELAHGLFNSWRILSSVPFRFRFPLITSLRMIIILTAKRKKWIPFLSKKTIGGTVKRPKFGNGPFFYNIFPGIKVVNTVSNSKRLPMFNSSMGNDCVEVFKCHVMICSSFVYLRDS